MNEEDEQPESQHIEPAIPNSEPGDEYTKGPSIPVEPISPVPPSEQPGEINPLSE